jgi:hypothetical protein
MGEIQLNGVVWRGNQRGELGMYKSKDGNTYAGTVKDSMGDGYGVIKYRSDDSDNILKFSSISKHCRSYCGYTACGEFAAGVWHGFAEVYYDDGNIGYGMYAHGKLVHHARVHSGGGCEYDGEYCEYDGDYHADFIALKVAAQQAGVRVPAPSDIRRTRVARLRPHSAPWFCVRMHGCIFVLGESAVVCSFRVCMRACACTCVCCSCVCVRR